MKYFWGAISFLLAMLAALTTFPQLIPAKPNLAMTVPVAHMIALRPWLAVAFLVAAIFSFFFAALRRRWLDKGRILATLGGVFLVVALVHGGTVLSRGITTATALGPDRGVSLSAEGNGSITVLTYNTLGGETSMEQLADAIEKHGIDVVSLPETSTARGVELTEMLAQRGLDFQHFDTGTDKYDPEFESTVLLISGGMGEYRLRDTGLNQATAVSAAPADGTGPIIIAAHPIAPIPALFDRWKTEVTEIYGVCETATNTILTGDFNSTEDHQQAVKGTCSDGAIEAGAGGLGTWPSQVPPLLGAPIDRVLHTGEDQGTTAMQIAVGKSDHRGLIVRLEPKGTTQDEG